MLDALMGLRSWVVGVTRISVVICTHSEERWESVHAAVASVRDQQRPAVETIVVVDHNRPLYERLVPSLPDATVVENHEPRGLSGGRNTGIAVANSDVIAFLDDDAVADAQWLMYLAEAYHDPAVAGVGGLTLPRWQTGRPRWFPEEFDWVIGCTYRGMPTSRAPVRNLMGGNASFRREIFQTIGGFRSGIGRSSGKLPLGCEETELCIRLRQELPHATLLFDNRAVIWHYIPDRRCRFSYFRTRCYAEGISKFQLTAAIGVADGLATERSYVRRTLPAGIARGMLDVGRGSVAGLGRSSAIMTGLACTAAGYAVGSLRGLSARKPVTGVAQAPSNGHAR